MYYWNWFTRNHHLLGEKDKIQWATNLTADGPAEGQWRQQEGKTFLTTLAHHVMSFPIYTKSIPHTRRSMKTTLFYATLICIS